MASVSVSHLIMFIASLVIAASVAGTMVAGVDRVSSSMGERSITVTDQIDTDIAIISDPGSGAIVDETDNGTVLSIYVKNTGSSTLDPSSSEVDVLVNGVYMLDITVDLVDGNHWRPSGVVLITIDHPGLDPGDHRITVIVRGNSDEIQFRT